MAGAIDVSVPAARIAAVTFMSRLYVIELKMWYGKAAHEKGLQQLSRYLDSLNLDTGYLIIYDRRKFPEKKWEQDRVSVNRKDIFLVWV